MNFTKITFIALAALVINATALQAKCNSTRCTASRGPVERFVGGVCDFACAIPRGIATGLDSIFKPHPCKPCRTHNAPCQTN